MPKMHRSKWLTAALFALLGIQLSLAPTAVSAESAESAVESPDATDPPQRTIEIFHAGLLEIMKHAKELGFQGRSDELAPLMDRCFDLEFMASKTVGAHWRKLSDEDKKRWVALFTRFTTANYAGRFTGFTGEKFITLGAEDAPRDTRVVLTKIEIPDKEDVELNYRLIERNGEWKVIDVFLNGTVSELALRRSEYSAALKRNGFEQLIASVETKIEDLKNKGQADG